MPISVVVGGQFGSEGKGKVAHFLAKYRRADMAVRMGGPNSGHTVINELGEAIVFRHLPTACLIPGMTSVIPPGSYLSVELLLEEISRLGATPGRVAIDPHAWIVLPEDVASERFNGLTRSIGSTGSGTGASLVRRIERRERGSFAKDVVELAPYLTDTSELLIEALNRNRRVVVEGTQGFGLSLLHSGLHPHCTSRDTIAAAFVAEAGLSPIDVDEIVMVLRSFPIRVAGNSGPLKGEIDWETVTRESGYSEPRVEYTSVTRKVRRVARFDAAVVRQAIAHNRPTCIAMNHLDYIDAACTNNRQVTQRIVEFVHSVEEEIGLGIDLLGFGPASLTWSARQDQTSILA